ncbi:hypothetical protein GCM10027418_31710 [Mariniluteicoccus endophyticus]
MVAAPEGNAAMTHANAALTPRHRLKVAQLVVDESWPVREVAARFQVSWPTVKRWADRYRAGQPMQDRSSRPHHSPTRRAKRRRSAASNYAYASEKAQSSWPVGSGSHRQRFTASCPTRTSTA